MVNEEPKQAQDSGGSPLNEGLEDEPKKDMPNPTEEDLDDPIFEAIW